MRCKVIIGRWRRNFSPLISFPSLNFPPQRALSPGSSVLGFSQGRRLPTPADADGRRPSTIQETLALSPETEGTERTRELASVSCGSELGAFCPVPWKDRICRYPGYANISCALDFPLGRDRPPGGPSRLTELHGANTDRPEVGPYRCFRAEVQATSDIGISGCVPGGWPGLRRRAPAGAWQRPRRPHTWRNATATGAPPA